MPSGILCNVTASTIIVCLLKLLFGPSTELSRCICGVIVSSINRKNIPSIKPATAGTNCIFPRLCDCSSAGIRRLQTDAAIITPAAKPLSIFVVFTESSFFIKSTHAAPSDVPINGINKPNMVDVIMVASYSAVFLFYTNFPYIKLYLPESIQLFRRKNMRNTLYARPVSQNKIWEV